MAKRKKRITLADKKLDRDIKRKREAQRLAKELERVEVINEKRNS